MTLQEFLSQFPGSANFSRRSFILLFAYFLRKYTGATEFDAADFRQCFRSVQRRVPTDLSILLRDLSRGRASPLLRVRSSVFALSAQGASEVEAILPGAPTGAAQLTSFLTAALPHLKKVIDKVTDSQEKEFLAEAISCIGAPARRATVIMTWVAAVHHLRQHVLAHGQTAFNTALKKRKDKIASLVIGKLEDFDDINEAAFIEVCRSAGLITKDVRKILDEKLGFRNSCAHPSSIHVGDAKVVSFVEDIVENVIVKYPT